MISAEKRGEVIIITFIEDRINALVTDEIRQEINVFFTAPNSKVIIDLYGVHYIDSSGFGCFLSIMKTARNNYGELRFTRLEPAIMELFHMLQLHTVFKICEDIDSCIRSFK